MKLKDYKKEILLKEYELLLVVFSANKADENKIRGWCITLLLIIFGSTIKLEVTSVTYLLLSILVIIIFFTLSFSQTYYLTNTRDRILYVQNILNKLHKLNEEEIEKIITPNILTKPALKELISIAVEGFKSKNLILFYLALTIMIIVSYVYILT